MRVPDHNMASALARFVPAAMGSSEASVVKTGNPRSKRALLANALRAAAAGATLLSAAPEAAAQSPESKPLPVALAWQAPIACPQQEAVLRDINAQLVGADGEKTSLQVEGVVRQGADGWTLQLQIATAGGQPAERELSAGSCQELADAAALLVALAYDRQELENAELAARKAEPEAKKGDAPKSSAPAKRAARADEAATAAGSKGVGDEAQGLAMRLRLGATFDLGSLARPALGADLRADLVGKAWIVGAGLLWFPPVATNVDSRPDVGGRVGLLSGLVMACYLPWAGSSADPQEGDFRLELCGRLEVGAMYAEGFGVETPGDGSAFWLTPLGEVGVDLPLTQLFSLRLAGAAGPPLLRPEFMIENVGLVHRAGPVIGRGQIDLAFTF